VTSGGEAGQTLTVKAGDVLVLPAGTGHRCVEHSSVFVVVGAYPHWRENYAIQRPDSRLHSWDACDIGLKTWAASSFMTLGAACY